MQLGLQRIGLGILIGVAQQLHFGQTLEPLLTGAAGRHGFDQGARFLELALACKQARSARLHAQQVGGIVDAAQQGIGLVEPALLFSDL